MSVNENNNIIKKSFSCFKNTTLTSIHSKLSPVIYIDAYELKNINTKNIMNYYNNRVYLKREMSEIPRNE